MLGKIAIGLIALGIGAYVLSKKRKTIRNKKVLVIGGSSGLGKALARQLYMDGNQVSIAARNVQGIQSAIKEFAKTENEVKAVCMDITNLDAYDEKLEQYDYIFCCPGASISKFITDLKPGDYETQMRLNYQGSINTLYHFRKHCKRPFTFVLVSSAAGLFFFPGYAAYSPSKAALLAFAEVAEPELSKEGIDLRVFVCGSMRTPGLEKEDKDKPQYTKDIEYSNAIMEPKDAASHLISKMHTRKFIPTDWFTYFSLIRSRCERIHDYLLFPAAVMVIFISKWYVKIKFNKLAVKKNN
ncbi:3-dehydrosphinganine reductase [Enteropsectra breve]|nr:3-dehydrosphinganine reductase [Enteropsectra breve]